MVPTARPKSISTPPPHSSSSDPHNTSVLTAAEREEITKYTNKGRRKTLPASFGLCPNDLGKLADARRQSDPARDYRYPAKADLLKRLARSRLMKGDTIEQISSDSTFDNVLEVCDSERAVYPAYKASDRMSADEYRSLRKCRYLRLSEMNIDSLKQATIKALVDA